MQQNVRVECPKCSRPLQKFNGHIGYCSLHKWVSPIGLGYDAEAAEQNRQDAAIEEKKRLEAEREKAEAEAQIVRERHQSAVRKAVAVVVALCLIAAAVVFFVVRPSVNYNNATDQFVAGEYESAKEKYSALGDYKDSAARVMLCEAMIDLQEGRPEAAAEKLERLTSEGQSDVAKQLAEALLPVIVDWKAKGLTPDALLLLINKADVIDPDGTLDIAALKVEGHTALLDGTQLSTYADDVNNDGMADLVVLNGDYTITVYRMTDNANVRIAVDNNVSASCAMTFGDTYKETDVSASVACFEEAYRLLPNDETRAALTTAYRVRSTYHENAGDMDAAILDARNAMETSGSAEDFTFFYDVNLRYCKNGNDAATAISKWDVFAANNVAELTRYSAKERWQNDAAQLHIAYAAELAAKKDAGCIAELNTVAEMGADVMNAIVEAESHFEPGLVLAELRLMEIDHANVDAEKQAIRSIMENEVRIAISEWKTRGVSPADIPALIHFADAYNIDLVGIDRESIYEEAAVAAAGYASQYTFVNWNGDAYKELLTLDAEGTLSLYGIDKTWHVVSSINAKLPGGYFTIADESAPLILVLSANKDEILAVTGTSEKLSSLFRESGISNYSVNGTTVTFSRLLEGSIVRYNDYTYEAVGTTNRPVRTGIDWQQNDYPQPANAAAAVQRYFESRAYDIFDEAALLTGTATIPANFSLEFLSALAVPDIPGTVNAVVYQVEDGRELFEVTYPSGTQTIRTWVAAEYMNGWKIVGAADAYGTGANTADVDYSIPLIGLNVETTNTLTAKGNRNTYRVLVPTAGRLGLIWQSGSKAVSRTSHVVSMHQGALTGDVVFSYEQQPSLNKQQSKDMFVSAGVYYVMVEARHADTEAYNLTITFESEANVELENNDTPAQATSVALNTAYSGSLSDAKDVDYFSFTLDETSAVNVRIESDGEGNRASKYICSVIDAENGEILSGMKIYGNTILSETGNLYLSSGEYLVQIKKGNIHTSNEYGLRVNTSQNGSMESEGNNAIESADFVEINEDIHASMGKEGDIDCFKFVVHDHSIIQTHFSFIPTDNNSKTYVLSLFDSSHRNIIKINIGGKEYAKVMPPIVLAPGEYYIVVENPVFVQQEYTLKLTSVVVDASEQEPNNSAAHATELHNEMTCTGVLSSSTDVDYYKLSFDKDSGVQIRFDCSIDSDDGMYVLSIEANGRTLKKTNVKSGMGGVEQTLNFAQGEYYLKVEATSSRLNDVYSIGVIDK